MKKMERLPYHHGGDLLENLKLKKQTQESYK